MEFETVRSLFLFNGMSDEEITLLMAGHPNGSDAVRLGKFSSGELISKGGEICCILKGSADIKVSESSDTIIRSVSSGDSFGAGMLYSASPSVTVAVARSRTTVLFVPKSTVDYIIDASPAAAKNYLAYLSGKISFLNRRIMAFSAGDTESKLAVYLYQISAEGKSTERILLKDPLTAVAKKLSMGRASLYRTLDSFESEGIIKREGAYISILKLDELLKIINN